MHKRDQRITTAKPGRTAFEIAITAAILAVIVLAGVNSQSVMSSIKCRAPYVAAACALLGAK